MNNYNTTTDYYNYMNNNYNQPVYTQNNKGNNIYDIYNSFIRGNMFADLYNEYKNTNPYEISPMNEQAELLTYIDMYSFALIELNLYLDIYPNNKDMLNLYNDYRSKLIEYTNNYEKKFGPLTLTSSSLNAFPWAWDNSPWPWEKK